MAAGAEAVAAGAVPSLGGDFVDDVESADGGVVASLAEPDGASDDFESEPFESKSFDSAPSDPDFA